MLAILKKTKEPKYNGRTNATCFTPLFAVIADRDPCGSACAILIHGGQSWTQVNQN